jgi:hypothetical protein
MKLFISEDGKNLKMIDAVGILSYSTLLSGVAIGKPVQSGNEMLSIIELSLFLQQPYIDNKL